MSRNVRVRPLTLPNFKVQITQGFLKPLKLEWDLVNGQAEDYI